MHKIELFEGAVKDTENSDLQLVAAAINLLKLWGATVERYNLQKDPQAFANIAVSELLQAQGEDVLPITLVDGKVVKTKEYPTNEEFVNFSGVEQDDDECGCGCDHADGCDCGCEHADGCDGTCEGHHH